MGHYPTLEIFSGGFSGVENTSYFYLRECSQNFAGRHGVLSPGTELVLLPSPTSGPREMISPADLTRRRRVALTAKNAAMAGMMVQLAAPNRPGSVHQQIGLPGQQHAERWGREVNPQGGPDPARQSRPESPGRVHPKAGKRRLEG